MAGVELVRRTVVRLAAVAVLVLSLSACVTSEDDDELRSRYHGVDSGPWSVTDDLHGAGR